MLNETAIRNCYRCLNCNIRDSILKMTSVPYMVGWLVVLGLMAL